MIHDGYVLPCYHSDGFCRPTTRTPYTLTWFDEKFCLIFRLQQSIGRMTRIKDRYWIEIDNFIESSNITQNFQSEGLQGTEYPNVKTPKSNVENPSLSQFEIYPIAQTFCGKPEPLFSAQNEDILDLVCHLRFDHRVLFARRLVPVPFVVRYLFYWIYLLLSLLERLPVFVQRLQDFAK